MAGSGNGTWYNFSFGRWNALDRLGQVVMFEPGAPSWRCQFGGPQFASHSKTREICSRPER